MNEEIQLCSICGQPLETEEEKALGVHHSCKDIMYNVATEQEGFRLF
jgi:hypothetical protein